MTVPRGPLHLSGELSLQVDGGGVQVHADGPQLRIVADDVGAFVARAREAALASTGVSPGRRDVHDLAETLAAHGVTAYLESPSGRVAALGSDVDSRVGALLLGTRRARPEAAAALLLAGRGRLLLATGAVVAGLATVLARRRR